LIGSLNRLTAPVTRNRELIAMHMSKGSVHAPIGVAIAVLFTPWTTATALDTVFDMSLGQRRRPESEYPFGVDLA
jgi:hypothetical protein